MPTLRTQSIPANASTILSLQRSDTASWFLREDIHRALIYKVEGNSQSVTRLGFLHPIDAVILALFDGRRDFSSVEAVVRYLFDLPESRARIAVLDVLHRWHEAMEEGHRPEFPRYDPSQFVVSAEEIDLTRQRLYKPLTLTFHVSDDCMRDCIYCNVEKRRAQGLTLLPIGRWRDLASEARSLGVASVLLGGGDPFMSRDICAIVGFFIDQHIQPTVSTKSYISDRTAARLAQLGLNRIQISIDAANETIADFLTNSKGSHHHAVRSIENLIGRGIRVRTNSVLTPYNVRQAPDLARFLIGLGVDAVHMTCYGSSMYSSAPDGLFVEVSDSQWLHQEIANLSKERNSTGQVSFNYAVDPQFLSQRERKERFRTRAFCSAGRWGFVGHSDGKVTLCDELPVREPFIVGDLTHQSIMDVWQSPLIEQLIFPPQDMFAGTVCHECTEFEACHLGKGRCFRDALKAFGVFHAPTPDCPRAPVGRRLC